MDDTKKQRPQPLIIAHRGACGYLPEHTLAAKAAAHAMGADYLEQDIVATADGDLVVLHDIYLDTVTDVATVFPGRQREDGRYYVIDFTLAELRKLTLHERVDLQTGQTAYSRRFPAEGPAFRIATFAEEIKLVQGMNRSTGREVGLYVEIKRPAWHRQQGHDICRMVLGKLTAAGYTSAEDRVIVESFDADEVRRMRRELKTQLKLGQLIGMNQWQEAPCDFAAMQTRTGLEEIATYASAIGPWAPLLVTDYDTAQPPVASTLAQDAHACGLQVHPFTFRADDLPPWAATFEELLVFYFKQVRVDGLFTDFPDLARQVRDAL